MKATRIISIGKNTPDIQKAIRDYIRDNPTANVSIVYGVEDPRELDKIFLGLKGCSDKEIGYDKGRDTKEYPKIPKSFRKKNRGRRN